MDVGLEPRLEEDRPYADRISAVRSALAEGRSLADAIAQEVELGASRDTVADDLDLLDARAVDLERPLDTDPGRDAPDRDGAGDPSAAQAHDGPLEDLDPLAVALDDLGRHLDGVTGGKVGQVGAELVLDDLVEHGHGAVPDSIWAAGLRVGVRKGRGLRRRRSIASPRQASVIGRQVRATAARPLDGLLVPPARHGAVIARGQDRRH